jgi:hypothetical protein
VSTPVPLRVRVVCPECHKRTRARRIPDSLNFRLAAHTIPLDAEEHPGQTCTGNPVVREDRLTFVEGEQ